MSNRGRRKSKKADFGSVTIMRSGRFQARFTDESGKRRSLGTFASERDANDALAAIRTDLRRGELIDRARGRVLFRDLASEVLEQRRSELAAGTWRNYQYLLSTTLLPMFGDRRISDITIRTVDSWWSRQAAHPVNRRNAHMVLSNVFRIGKRWGYLAVSPCQVVDASKDASKPRPVHSVDEFLAVLGHMKEESRHVFWVMFSGHLRIHELTGLNRSD